MSKWSDEYRKSLKSMDTEEHIDLAFYRPIGFMWAQIAARLGITPNVITIASIFLGIGAGVMFYYQDLWINIAGMLLLIWANSFDSADGQLARITHQYSRLGRILDGLSGDFWFAAIYIAIILRENLTIPLFQEHPWLLWSIALLAGACHAKQASMADYYRQFHLYFLKGEGGSELDNAEDLNRQLKESGVTWKNNFWKCLTMRTYLNYTVQQEASSPSMQRLRRELNRRFQDGKIPLKFREEFRRLSLPLMKYTNILTFNWRTIGLFITLFIGQPWLYFIYELTILNIILAYMMYRHEHLCKQLTIQLKEGKY
ncbi:CDP-alcohol phosphatidyltransferase family protein [Duncaniella freteri]|jgi:phosphatidylglycerophosphate synthase|uniref:CDP-alcohol phosphatidyltransferase family protein n=5 Tax=Duncaniella TaxID=2518495 RepID=A0A4Z0V6V0_9BACT|nr:CDP-alcohol phosphatidyltransferase family protein [Duncaniella freteri]MDE7028255.1 CDP-alcohol phosphatidyltransferase family protein [Duncaniella freteri]NBJ06367.1 CDP-alcohol phosphatidyltransferase family protein [Alistipes sp. Z76]NCE68456.1 CDP-alcohol phosphatidyltransferase family protein [Muribaculaceae bacterium M3]TGG40044.1 CDP-alcohol phosphatidyltransferase family protein [Duncaniella freteri]